MPYSGPFQYGDRVQLTDAKRRHYTLVLEEGAKFHSHRGIIEHSQIVGMDEGSVVTSTLGSDFLLFRHLMVDHVLSMPRGAAVIIRKTQHKSWLRAISLWARECWKQVLAQALYR